MIYNFPRTRFVDDTGLHTQLQHIQAEVEEVFDAYFHEREIERLAEELMDVIHSAETALRMLQEKRGVSPSRIRRDVEQKNALRHYYRQGDMTA